MAKYLDNNQDQWEISANVKIIFWLFTTHSVTNSRRLQGSWRKQRWPASSHTNFPMETNKVCKDALPPYELAQWVENLFKGAFTFSCIGVFHKVPLRWPKVTIFQASQSWHQMSVYENKILVQNCLQNEWTLWYILLF